MKREDVSKVFEGATKEQIDAILNINSADIGAVKSASEQAKQELEAVKAQLTAAQGTIAELEKAKGDADALQKQIDAYKQADADREKAAAEAKAREALEARFNSVSGDRTFIHDLVRKGVLEDFIAATQANENAGKGDKEIFDTLTRDKNYFASQNPIQPNMGGMNPDITPEDTSQLSDAEFYAQYYAKK